jgi:hypothetical protein
MDKGLTVPKWVLIVWPKIPTNAPKCICPICLASPKVLDFNEKKASLGVPSLCALHNLIFVFPSKKVVKVSRVVTNTWHRKSFQSLHATFYP